jgi:hypothetical protein
MVPQATKFKLDGASHRANTRRFKLTKIQRADATEVRIMASLSLHSLQIQRLALNKKIVLSIFQLNSSHFDHFVQV